MKPIGPGHKNLLKLCHMYKEYIWISFETRHGIEKFRFSAILEIISLLLHYLITEIVLKCLTEMFSNSGKYLSKRIWNQQKVRELTILFAILTDLQTSLLCQSASKLPIVDTTMSIRIFIHNHNIRWLNFTLA